MAVLKCLKIVDVVSNLFVEGGVFVFCVCKESPVSELFNSQGLYTYSAICRYNFIIRKYDYPVNVHFPHCVQKSDFR